jgi:hypothetical protein
MQLRFVERCYFEEFDGWGCGCDYMLFTCRVVYPVSLIHILLLHTIK